MKSIFFRTLLLLSSVGSLQMATAIENSCMAPGRNTGLCYEMKHIRSLLNVMEAQSDLMQSNFKLLETSALDMDRVVTSMLVRHSFNTHMSYAQDVRAKAQLIASESHNASINAFQLVRELRESCQTCHAAELPPSGHKWEEISAGHWNKLTANCSAVGRNPYVCRSMFAMLVSLNYFNTSRDSGFQNFQMISELGSEIVRVANDLDVKKAVHTPELAFNEIKMRALELVVLANSEDPAVFEKSQEMQLTCLRCHGVR
jgi:hypothetical protein